MQDQPQRPIEINLHKQLLFGTKLAQWILPVSSTSSAMAFHNGMCKISVRILKGNTQIRPSNLSHLQIWGFPNQMFHVPLQTKAVCVKLGSSFTMASMYTYIASQPRQAQALGRPYETNNQSPRPDSLCVRVCHTRLVTNGQSVRLRHQLRCQYSTQRASLISFQPPLELIATILTADFQCCQQEKKLDRKELLCCVLWPSNLL